MTRIDFDRVTCRAGVHLLLREVSLSLRAGERMVLAGPNGSGKTTLLRLIAGLAVPHSGQVRLGGSVASSAGALLLPPAQRRVAMVFQDLGLWPHLRVRRHLMIAARQSAATSEAAEQAVESLLQSCDLLHLDRRRAAELSGGEQQRLALARALAAQPDIILFDEPFAALDVQQKRTALILIERALALRPMTMVFVAHRYADVRDLKPERYCFLKAGTLVINSDQAVDVAKLEDDFVQDWMKGW